MGDLALAESMSRLGTETAFEVLARAKRLEAAGRAVVHLEIGEPDFDTPANIVDAAVQALREGWTHYGPAAGLPELREAIARDAGRRRGVSVAPENVLVTPGGKPVMFYLMLALLGPGSEAIFPDPGFPIYESMISFTGARPVPIPLREERGFRLDVEELTSLISDRTRLIIINSPHNPTGAVLDPDEVRAIAEIAGKHGIYLLSDEIYSRILYESRHETPLLYGDRDRIVVLDGYSKTFAMTGWRAGYGIGPAPLIEELAKLQTNAASCTASFTQRACIEALEGPQESVDAMVAEFRHRRDVIVARLEALPGVSCRRPGGAFYVFPNIRATGRSSKEMESDLLEKAGVAALAGTAFGRQGEGFLRFSYANSVAMIETAMDRLEALLAGRPIPQ